MFWASNSIIINYLAFVLSIIISNFHVWTFRIKFLLMNSRFMDLVLFHSQEMDMGKKHKLRVREFYFESGKIDISSNS